MCTSLGRDEILNELKKLLFLFDIFVFGNHIHENLKKLEHLIFVFGIEF